MLGMEEWEQYRQFRTLYIHHRHFPTQLLPMLSPFHQEGRDGKLQE